MNEPEADPLTLRDRLRALCRAVLARWLAGGNQLDGGMQRLGADSNAVLAAIDDEAAAFVVYEPAGRSCDVDADRGC